MCGSGSLGYLFLIPGLVQATHFLAHLVPFCSPSSLNCFLFNPSPEIFESQALFFFQNIYLFIWLQRVAAPGIFHCGAFSAALRLSYPVACETLVPPPGGESASPTLESRFLTTGPPRKSPGSFPARNPSRILSLRACHLSFSWALSLVTPWVRLCLKLCSVDWPTS